MEIKDIILELYKSLPDNLNVDLLKDLKRKYSKLNNLTKLPTNIQIIQEYQKLVQAGIIEKNLDIERALRKRAIRSQSGIVPVQVLMKPFPCSGECIFCPNDASMPKSYINTEPGAMRALLNEFDPFKQVYNRLLSLQMTGHNTDKIEMIILGGTFDCYPMDYKISFVKSIYDACNSFEVFKSKINIDYDNPKSSKFSVSESFDIKHPADIQDSLLANETAENRIIGLTIETRPEFVTDKNCRFWRQIGVTRVEMGVQSLFDDVLKANLRGNTVQQMKNSFAKLKAYGFKISAHFMPGLFKSSIEKDIETMQIAFSNPGFRPDEIKFYPTSVIPNTGLYDLYKNGEYKPLTDNQLEEIIKHIKYNIIPPYTRIKRLIRDIPSDEIIAGSKITNLRQLVVHKMEIQLNASEEKRKSLYSRMYNNLSCFNDLNELIDSIKNATITEKDYHTFVYGEELNVNSIRNFVCLCTRCREVRNAEKTEDNGEVIVFRVYKNLIGLELFISIEDNLGYLGGFVRLMLPNKEGVVDFEGLGEGCALVRELHVYGEVAKISEKNEDKTQHKGYGSRLMQLAEQISKKYGYTKLSVISGIGVRNYYYKLGYEKQGTYMVKNLV